MTIKEGEAGPAERATAEQDRVPSPRQEADGQETEPLSGSIAAPPKDARELALEIERTREQLGETVQELLARADVKSRALAKATEVSEKYKSTAGQLRGRVAAGARQHWMPLTAAAGVVIIGYLAVRYGRCDR